jgi:hypothetical protein
MKMKSVVACAPFGDDGHTVAELDQTLRPAPLLVNDDAAARQGCRKVAHSINGRSQ